MAIDQSLKKDVIQGWRNAFPQLTAYTQNKLYKVTGPTIIGIELIDIPRTEEYRPHFVIYPLWGTNIKTSLRIPIILKEYYNKKRLQYTIPYKEHSIFFNEVIESIKKQTPIAFDENISLGKVLSILDDYSRTPPLSAAPDSYLQAVLQEAKLKIALSVGIYEAQEILNQINKKSWNKNHFEACGVNVNNWLHNLQETITNSDEFMNQIQTNKQDKKILQLNSSELTA